MNRARILRELQRMSVIPEPRTSTYAKWLEQDDFVAFLRNATTEDIPLYVSYRQVFIYTVLLPRNCLKGDYVRDLIEWNCTPDSTWSYEYEFGATRTPKRIRVLHPLHGRGSTLLEKASPLTFLRYWEGETQPRAYVEVCQPLTHLHGLH